MEIEYRSMNRLKRNGDESEERSITFEDLMNISYANRSMSTSIGVCEISGKKLLCRIHDHGESIHKMEGLPRDYYLLIAELPTDDDLIEKNDISWNPCYKGKYGDGLLHQIIDEVAEVYVTFTCTDRNLVAEEKIDPKLFRILITEEVINHFS